MQTFQLTVASTVASTVAPVPGYVTAIVEKTVEDVVNEVLAKLRPTKFDDLPDDILGMIYAELGCPPALRLVNKRVNDGITSVTEPHQPIDLVEISLEHLAHSLTLRNESVTLKQIFEWMEKHDCYTGGFEYTVITEIFLYGELQHLVPDDMADAFIEIANSDDAFDQERAFTKIVAARHTKLAKAMITTYLDDWDTRTAFRGVLSRTLINEESGTAFEETLLWILENKLAKPAFLDWMRILPAIKGKSLHISALVVHAKRLSMGYVLLSKYVKHDEIYDATIIKQLAAIDQPGLYVYVRDLAANRDLKYLGRLHALEIPLKLLHNITIRDEESRKETRVGQWAAVEAYTGIEITNKITL